MLLVVGSGALGMCQCGRRHASKKRSGATYQKHVRLLLTPPGARSTVHCATAPRVEEEPDKVYYHSSCVPIAPSALALDRDLARWLWDWSAEAAALGSEHNLPPEA